MDSFTIKDLENLSGIKAHTLRIWEQRYDFLKPSRTLTKIRYYKNEELKKILNISLLNKYGYKVSHINRMRDEEISEKILTLTQPQAQQERIVNALIQNMVDLDIDALETTVDDYILVRGIEKTITQIIFPFLERIGILWQTGNINPAQEHLISNLIRQKLIIGVESVQNTFHIKTTALLFLPEGEHHELGLLFMYYLLKSRGARVIYLGANIPLKDVAYVVNVKKPGYLYCHLTTVTNSFNFEKFVASIAREFKQVKIVISGELTRSYEKKLSPHVTLKKSFQEVMDFVTDLE